jgi:hypothetical protein
MCFSRTKWTHDIFLVWIGGTFSKIVLEECDNSNQSLDFFYFLFLTRIYRMVSCDFHINIIR